MVKIEWWYDDTIWPGPPDQAWRLPWNDPMVDTRSAIQRFADDVFVPIGRTFGKSLHEVMATYKPIIEAIQDLTKKQEKRDTGAGRVRNHGPRTNTTYDNRGRRRY